MRGKNLLFFLKKKFFRVNVFKTKKEESEEKSEEESENNRLEKIIDDYKKL